LLFDVVDTRDELDDGVLEHAQFLRAQGRRPYAVPRGGATATGGIGYAYAARELTDQCEAADITARTVVVATGSGGPQAGLVAGKAGFDLPWRLVGASVSRPAHGMADHVLRLSRECAAALGLDEPYGREVQYLECLAAGIEIQPVEVRESTRLALEHEGLLLDDYYGAKAMTLFRTLLAADAETPAVFWHTGGMSAALAALAGSRP
jgi:D-cysteine desulfhydrase